jgi:chaperonin cofactor prefoldin
MSQAQVGNEGQDNNVASSEAQNAGSGMVKYESYEKVLSQKKAVDSKLKELESALNEFRAKEKAEEEGKLMAEKRHEELIARLKADNEQLQSRIASTQTEIANSLKRQALERELGGFARPEYSQFADLSAIQLGDDGSVDLTSLSKEVARFREHHPHLLKTQVKPPQSGAPQSAMNHKTDPEKAYYNDIEQRFGIKVI